MSERRGLDTTAATPHQSTEVDEKKTPDVEHLLAQGYTPEQVRSLIDLANLTHAQRAEALDRLNPPGKKDPIEDLYSKARETLAHGLVRQLAVEGPALRYQSHDDVESQTARPYLIGTLCVDDPWLVDGRGRLIGAVVRHGEEVWMLVNPKHTRWARFMDAMREACEQEGPEEYVKFWTGLPPDERKNWKNPEKVFPNYFGKKARSK